MEVRERKSSPMPIADFALAHRLEARDAWENAQSVAAYDCLYPHVGAFASPVGGGYAMYAGPDSPLTQAMGLGMNGPVGEHELDQMEALYRDHGAAVQIELCSLADPSLLVLLTERGYQVVERSHVLYRPLRSFDVNVPVSADVHVRVPAPDEADVWAYTVAAGFAGSGAIPPPDMDVFLSFFHLPDATCFLARVGGQAAGGGVVSTAQGTAALFP